MKAILLARVSSADQEDTHSIPAQVDKITKYAKSKSLVDFELFKLTETSTKANRNKFNQIYITASLVLDLAKRAYAIFESSETHEKRQLINHVFQNCFHDGEKLVYKLKEPFNIILTHANLPIWQGQ